MNDPSGLKQSLMDAATFMQSGDEFSNIMPPDMDGRDNLICGLSVLLAEAVVGFGSSLAKLWPEQPLTPSEWEKAIYGAMIDKLSADISTIDLIESAFENDDE